jgi:predicted nucleic-acid-binding protein
LTRWYADTNVLLRHLLGDHPELSPRADAFWEAVRESRLEAVLTEGVLMEAVYVLTKFYKVPRAKASQALAGVLRYSGLIQEPAGLFGDALELFAAKNLDFVDCLLMVRERSGRGRVFSFDAKVNRG